MAQTRRKQPEPMTLIPLTVVQETKKKMDQFTPRQRILAEFIIRNPESVAFLSITELARKTGVSLATIVRFSHTLGYHGYSDFSREAQQTIQSELSTTRRFQLARHMRKASTESRTPSAFERVLANEIDNLINLAQSIDTAEFYRCIEMMEKADRICIVGCMASSFLANFFGYMLSKVFPKVDVLHGHALRTYAVCKALTPKSLVFLLSFPRYPKATVELGRLAAEKGANIVAITNSHISPVVPLAGISFFIPVGIVSFVDAYAAPLTFIHGLITEFSERNPQMTQRGLKEFDTYAWKEELFLRSGARGMVHEASSGGRGPGQSSGKSD